MQFIQNRKQFKDLKNIYVCLKCENNSLLVKTIINASEEDKTNVVYKQISEGYEVIKLLANE